MATNGVQASAHGRSRWQLMPAACDVSVTNACNAACDFCSFARNKHRVERRRWIDRGGLARALPILYRRGIRYLNFQGGEPLMHREIQQLVADARAAGMRPTIITNGWFLPQKLPGLIAAGLNSLLVSIDSHSMALHENNRGLPGLGQRLGAGLKLAREAGLSPIASVTMSRLVEYDKLPELLKPLGFDAVTFCYPRRAALGSSSLIYEQNSDLLKFEDGELIAALSEIRALKRNFRVLNSSAALGEIERHIRGEPECFPCVGGHKYFYLDWDLNIWRCEDWKEPMGSVFDFERIPDQRDRCTACMISCYRDTSVLMHAGIALADAARALAQGRVEQATGLLARRSVGRSLGAVTENLGQLTRML